MDELEAQKREGRAAQEAAWQHFNAGRMVEAASSARRSIVLLRAALGDNHPQVGVPMLALGLALRADDPKAAEMHTLEAARLLGTGRPSELCATGWFQAGLMAKARQDYDAAGRRLDKAMEVYRAALGDGDANVAAAAEQAGLVHSLARRRKLAIARFQQAKQGWSPTAGLSDGNARRASYYLGREYVKARRFQEGRTELLALLSATEAVEGERGRSLPPMLVELGACLVGLSAYEQGRLMYERALDIGREVYGQTSPALEHILLPLGTACTNMGAYKDAGKYLRSGIRILEVNGRADTSSGMQFYNQLGINEKRAGRLKLAVEPYETALGLARRVYGPTHANVGRISDNLGELYAKLGDYDRARRLYEEGESIFMEALGPNHPSLAINLNNQAALLKEVGDYDGALFKQRKAAKILMSTRGEDHPQAGVVLDNLATALADAGEYSEAVTLYRRALSLHERHWGKRNPKVATNLNNLAWTLNELGKTKDALAIYERAVGIYEETLGRSHPSTTSAVANLGGVLGQLGRFDEARKKLIFARRATIKALGKQHPWVAQREASLSMLELRAGRPKKALAHAVAALDVAEKTAGVLMYASSERERLQIVAEARRRLDAVLGLSNDADAYARVLSWKGQVLSSMVAQRGIARATDNQETQARLERLGVVRGELATLTVSVPDDDKAESVANRIVSLRTEKERLERDLARSSASFAADQAWLRAGPKAVCKRLGATGALVDILRFERFVVKDGRLRRIPEFAAFVLRGDRCGAIERISLGKAEPIEGAVKDFRQVIYDEGDADLVIEEARAVRELVWDPVAPALAGVETVWLSPDGALHGIPFGAFPVGEETVPEETRYLIEDIEIAYVASARDLTRDAVAGDANRQQRLVVGGVDYESVGEIPAPKKPKKKEPKAEQNGKIAPPKAPKSRAAGCGLERKLAYGYLPGSKSEADAVAKALAAAKPVVVTGGAADEASVKSLMQSSRTIHLATHGYFASECRKSRGSKTRGGGQGGRVAAVGANPLVLSGIALAGANRERRSDRAGEDGILTAEEVAALDLSGVELAILSACETGLGDIQSGEGVLGLRWAFAVAGAQSLVMSLWKVPDDETRQLMERFYAEVEAGGGVATRTALRRAQIALLKRLRRDGDPNPWAWAAFIPSGA